MKKYLKGQHLNQFKVKSCQSYEKELVARRRRALAIKLAELKLQHKQLVAENSDIEEQISQAKMKLDQSEIPKPKNFDETAR
jgi:hypothetical protein